MSVACADLTSAWVSDTSFPDVIYAQGGGFPVVSTEQKWTYTFAGHKSAQFKITFDTPLPPAQYLFSASYGANDGELRATGYDDFQIAFNGDDSSSGNYWSYDAGAVQDNYATSLTALNAASTGIVTVDYQCEFIDIYLTYTLTGIPTEAGFTLKIYKVGEAGPG